MKTIDLSQYDKEALIEIVIDLHNKLEKKKHDLTTVRQKLLHARKRFIRLKEVLQYQQRRIIDLSGNRMVKDIGGQTQEIAMQR